MDWVKDVLHWLITAHRIADATSTAHLDKVERGYENMNHYNVEFGKVGEALHSIDFIQGEETETAALLLLHHTTVVILTFIARNTLLADVEDEEEEDEDGETGVEEEEAAQTVPAGNAVTPVSVQPSEPQQLNSSPVKSDTSC